ncbi:uncharacterized protein A4U43_C04F4450 [Asparagus officinalis]|uniref:UvrD-like helicase ATP-binding domain-containing protein n=1 Tax=Asparagus officinalis TaxID=4686 RepID=A0A5P1EYX1_ASPOF|nr:uncharacterized protein A4U43_C04F4450 [Asparagus officinalis]
MANTVEGDNLPGDLLDLVFSWSLDDVLDGNLYKEKVEKIPTNFHSVSQYFRSFMFPLLEETRMGLCSSMETITTSLISEVIWIKYKDYNTMTRRGLYDVKVGSWKNRYNASRDETYSPSPGDILILSNVKPETVTDLSRFGSRYVLASVTRVKDEEDVDEDDNEQLPDFTVSPSRALDGDGELEKYRHAIFLANITTNSRVWSALGLGRGLGSETNIIQRVLAGHSLRADDSCDECPAGGLDTSASNYPDLNDSQRGAITDLIATAQCKHRSSVKLIWGPPGTGKTKTLSSLLCTLLTMKHRVLVCAPTNVAITEVASRVLKLVQNSCLAARRAGFSCYSLGDIVLFGDKNRLKVDDNLRDIFIDYRTDRLLRCLSGWRHHASSMIQFLESCVYRHHIDGGDATFLDFVTERFSCLAFPLKTCMVSLCTHLTTSTISRENFDYISTLINLLDAFESLIHQANVSDGEQLCEPHLATTQSPNGSILYSTGYQLLHTLRSLCKNVQTPTFQKDKRQVHVVQSFCLNTASLIFCTASTSFRLYSKKLKLAPLDLLVIDEAGQLKESESTIPVQLPGIQHAILIGDERQLPATIKSKVSEGVGFGRSLFERLSALGHPKHLVQIQYRMHPSISLFPNAKFYGGQILDGANVQRPSYEKFYLPGKMYGPFSVINVVDGREEHDDVGHSLKNMVEVAVIFQIIQRLYKACCTMTQKLTVGVISPYSAQVAAIQEKLRNMPTNDYFVVTVKSVDGFQGGEKDLIIISTVRANENGCIGFVSNRQRANVALTRARHCLWIIGNGATLAKSDSVWKSLVHNAKQRACFFDADEDKVLAKTILQTKKELDQMDDLLSRDSLLFRNALWKVLFSGDFIKSFVDIRSVQLKKGVIHLLLKLASGWRPKRSNAFFTSESSSQHIMQFKIENFCIICTIDIMKYSRHTQVLKIWDILPLSRIPNLVKRLDSIFKTYSDEYVNLCRTKSVDYRNMEVPTTWDANTSFLKHKILLTEEPTEKLSDCGTIECVNFVENSKVSESLLLMKFYSLRCGTVKHLLSSTDGKEVDLPFEVTDHERDIILYPQTAFILGRSGTGKTTVLTMKLIKKEQMWYFSSGGHSDLLIENSGSPWKPSEGLVSDENFLRQLFVTVSPKLCSAVSNHIERLKSFLCGGEYSSKNGIDMYDIGDSLNAFSDIPDSFKNITQKNYPLIITFQKFLVMLDGSLENSFFDKFDDGRELSLKRTGVSRSFALQTLIRKKEVTYSRFLSSYWPHFNTQLTKKLDSSIVFTEIISHLKGDITSNVPFDSWLDREAYVGLSERRASSLNCDAREIIYDIFLAYEKMKLRNREFDISDLVCDLHRRAKVYGRNVGVQMDFVYIDEVQDLTMRQISLFKYVCKNFSEGFVFAGDTAQTIARGVDFRFEDIRSLFYTVFLQDPSCDPMKSFKGKSKSISDMFHLNQNFRTHAGVLKLAQSVIDILCFYFPHSLDRLEPETSLIFGEPPILLRSRCDENALMTLFGHSTDSSCSHFNGFGADQVILVRDELSKQKVPENVRKHALVLTILECKGLEFQDVLVYNFFGDSPLQNHWRMIYDYMNSQCLLDPSTNSFQRFEIAHHNILRSELKQLYVAITRTRQRLWICENHEDYSQPMFDYWNKLGLVKFRWLDSSFAQSMSVASSSEDWRDRGIKLFNEGNYEMATMCFEHAGDTFREKWYRASSLRASAEHIINSDNKNGRHLLIEAAEIYESIGKVELEASCYIELKDFQKAGLNITFYLLFSSRR